MPFYHRVYSPGELPFITASTYRRTPLFLSDRFRRGFVRKSRGPWNAGPRYELEEVRQEWHFLLVGWVLTQQPGDARPGEFPRRLAVVKLEVLLLAGCVNSPHGSDALSSTYEKSLRDRRLPKAGVCASRPTQLLIGRKLGLRPFPCINPSISNKEKSVINL